MGPHHDREPRKLSLKSIPETADSIRVYLSVARVNRGPLKPFKDSEIKAKTEGQTEMWEDWELGFFQKVDLDINSG